MLRILEIVIGVVFLFWLIGLILSWFGWLIHLALLVAVVLIVVRFIQGKKTA